MRSTSPIVVRLFVLPFALASLLLPPHLLSQTAANSPAILIEPVSTDDAELNRKVKALESSPCNGQHSYHEHPVTVTELVGGKVQALRVVRVTRDKGSATNEELRNLVEKVWQGQFQSAACQIIWAESTIWSMEAVVEFEDGKQAELITDGNHVAVCDHNGKCWFLRLLPAAQ